MRRDVFAVLVSCACLAPRIARADDPGPRPADVYHVDDEGRRMRVRFDPGARLYVGARVDDGGVFTGEAGLLLRERDDEGVRWKLEHALLEATARTEALTLTAYRGRFLRWSKDGSLVIPTAPPWRLHLPFDLGFDVRVGRVALAADTVDVGAASADVLFDFWGSYAAGNHLALVSGFGYDLTIARDVDAPVAHVITPMSRVGLDLAWTYDRGRQLVAARATWARRLVVQDGEQRWGSVADAALAWEGVLLALNDDPVSLRLEGTWRWDGRDHVVGGSVGLRFAIPTD